MPMPGIARTSALPHGVVLALAAAIAAVLGWRAIATGVEAVRARAAEGEPAQAAGAAPADAAAKARIARDPTDVAALLALGGELERSGRRVDAAAAMRAAAALAPADPQVLVRVAGHLLRSGDEAQGLATLGRAADAGRGELADVVVRAFVAALDSGRHREFFASAARANPAWWPAFFRQACVRALGTEPLAAVVAARAEAALAAPEEWQCAIGRLQREGEWARAHQLWLNSLPPDARRRVGHVFNGGFESWPTNAGFDWVVAPQDGVSVTAESAAGATGARSLAVTYANVRYANPPVFQYLMLGPGRHRLDARGRIELESTFGLQWGLYCDRGASAARRPLARTGASAGRAGWDAVHAEFVVPADCPVQRLELELAGPGPDGQASAGVAAKLRGTIRFDDLAIRFLD